MSWIKEINGLLIRKSESALGGLSMGQRRALRGGCAAFAIDGLFRGALPIEDYLGLFRRGGVFTFEETVRTLEGIQSDNLGEFNFFSSSPKPFGIDSLEAKPLSHRHAEELVERIRDIECLGVLVVTKMEEGKGHIASLIGDNSAIIQFDARRRPYVEKISSKKALRTLRMGQKRGVIIEWR